MKRSILPEILKKEILEELYLKQLKPANQIAKDLDVKKHNVLSYLKKYAIRKVERWERYGVRKFNKKQKEYLFGSLLGDDCLVMQSNGKYPHLQVIHSGRFKDYVEWKYVFWKKLVRGDIKRSSAKTDNKIFPTCCFRTAAHPGFLSFYQNLYIEGKKQITEDWLNNLTPLSLAVWYMDDGYFRKSRGRIHFITLAFGKKGNEIIRSYFLKKWQISTNLQKVSQGQDSYYLWMNTENSIKFTKIIAPYILPCFSYKIDKNRTLR